MAEKILDAPDYVTSLVNALNSALPLATIECELAVSDRYRLVVTSPHFENMGHPDRQVFVWNIAEKLLAADQLLKISGILTFAPSEFPSD